MYQGEWDSCKRINATVNCYRTREVHCRGLDSGKPAPWRHCGSEDQRPASVEECPQCQQDCVVSMWSEWTSCDGRNAYSTRSRFVVAPQLQDGRPCPALRERKRCEAEVATIAELDRSHTWKLGAWRECVPFSERDCGPGTRSRSVECMDLQGRSVNRTLCLQQEAYRRVLPPPLEQLCDLPCSCRLSEWSDWSTPYPDCSLPTPSLVHNRSRSIEQQPTLGGTPCGALKQIELLGGDLECPDHFWETSSWSDCSVSDEGSSCGAGYRRRYTYCLERDIHGVVTQVDMWKCNSTEQPTTLAPCDVPCVQQCQVSDWSYWSHCPNDTCNTIISQRSRDILVEPFGFVCPHLAEVRECPPIPCAQWVPGEWSSCFPTGGQDCGQGDQSRNIQCHDAAGNVIPDSFCGHLQLPNRDVCYKHCPNDSCVISNWGRWSTCSETCGNFTGVRTRSRYVAVNSSGLCPHHEGQLSQVENCSVDTPCHIPVFHIQYGEWGECLIPTNATSSDDGEMCSGTRTRTATCYRDSVAVVDSDCLIDSRHIMEPCTLPCSTDCVMSEWSRFTDCSERCIQTRSRRLIKFGENCPSVDSSGLEIETLPCDCGPTYDWLAEETWDNCQPFPTPLSQLSQSHNVNPLIPDPGTVCGEGYQTRSVECTDSDGTVVEDNFCDSQTRPSSVKPCIVKCIQRCIVTDWSEYSMCSSNMIERTREIIPFAGYENYRDNCLELESIVQVDGQSCPQHDFSAFTWSTSYDFKELHSCYLPPDKICGPGMDYKTIVCINNSVPEMDKKAASPDFCASVGQHSQATESTCNENCNIDCVYVEPGWSQWSDCSVSCGVGVKTRTRTIARLSQGVGRPCGHLNETTTCDMPACNFYKQSYTSPSMCQPVNETLGCGEGRATSDLVCYVNGVAHSNTSACEPSLGPKPLQRSVTCRVPCDGECVWSEWTAFEWCPDCSSCYKRTRYILRLGPDCSGGREQYRPCPMEEVFWKTHQWTDCIVEGSHSDYCGAGIQRRIVECWLGDKVTYDERCSHLMKPVSERPCSVACPVDCVVGPFGEWSSCGDCSTDLRATVTRERRVLVWPQNEGRSCPHQEEEKACPNIGCDEYFVETNSSALDCSAELTDEVCGLVSHDILLCRKNTVYVSVEECLRANASGKVVHNSELLTRGAELYCNIDCPTVELCEFTEFEEWSECLYLCNWPYKFRFQFQFRTQTLLSSWEGSQEACHKEQVEVRVCTPTVKPTNETLLGGERQSCIDFEWVMSIWYSNDTRDVACHSDGSQVADTACIMSDQPVSKRSSTEVGICDCPMLGDCNKITTECYCVDGFEMAGSLCLPATGCLNGDSDLWNRSQQCLPGEVCSEEDSSCVCPEGVECIQPTVVTPPSVSGFPTATVTMGTTGEGPTEEKTGTKPSGE